MISSPDTRTDRNVCQQGPAEVLTWILLDLKRAVTSKARSVSRNERGTGERAVRDSSSLRALMHECRIHDERLDECKEHYRDNHDSSDRPSLWRSVSDSCSGVHDTYPFPASEFTPVRARYHDRIVVSFVRIVAELLRSRPGWHGANSVLR